MTTFAALDRCREARTTSRRPAREVVRRTQTRHIDEDLSSTRASFSPHPPHPARRDVRSATDGGPALVARPFRRQYSSVGAREDGLLPGFAFSPPSTLRVPWTCTTTRMTLVVRRSCERSTPPRLTDYDVLLENAPTSRRARPSSSRNSFKGFRALSASRGLSFDKGFFLTVERIYAFEETRERRRALVVSIAGPCALRPRFLPEDPPISCLVCACLHGHVQRPDHVAGRVPLTPPADGLRSAHGPLGLESRQDGGDAGVLVQGVQARRDENGGAPRATSSSRVSTR